MAESISLVFRNGPTKIDTVELDVSITESHSSEVTITDHPVERGANISDHSRPEPDKLTIEGLITNTPFNRTQRRRIVNAFGQNFDSNTLRDQNQGVPGYAEAAIAKLRALRKRGDLITVVTHIITYTNMVMTSLNIPRDRSTGDAVRFTASFKQVIVVENKTTKKTVAREPKAQRKVKAGKQTPKATPDAERKKSIAFSTAEKLGLLKKLGIVS